MGLLDTYCEECGNVIEKGGKSVISKETKKVYGTIVDYQKNEKKVFGFKSICDECAIALKEGSDQRDSYEEEGFIQMIPVTTTSNIEGRKILEYRGVIGTQVIFGANIIKDIIGGITDIVGGRSGTIEKVLKDGRNRVIKQLIDDAISEGANAIIGMKIDFEVGSMYMFHATGTAVVVDKETISNDT